MVRMHGYFMAVNKSKTEGVRAGSLRNTLTPPEGALRTVDLDGIPASAAAKEAVHAALDAVVAKDVESRRRARRGIGDTRMLTSALEAVCVLAP